MFGRTDRSAGIRLLNKDLLNSFYEWLSIEQLAQLLLDKDQAPFVLNALFKRKNKYGAAPHVNHFFKHILHYPDKDFQFALRGIADTNPVFHQGLYAGMAWLKKTNNSFPLSENTLTALVKQSRTDDCAISIVKLFFHDKIPRDMKKEAFHEILDMKCQEILSNNLSSFGDYLHRPELIDFFGFCQDVNILPEAPRQELLSGLKEMDVLAFLIRTSLYPLYLKLGSPPEIDKLKEKILSFWDIGKATTDQSQRGGLGLNKRLCFWDLNGSTPVNVRFALLELLMNLPLNQEKDLPLIQAGLLEALQQSSLGSTQLKLADSNTKCNTSLISGQMS